MFCTNCGKKIDDSAMFCIHCGTSTTTSTSNQQTDTLAPEVTPSADKLINEATAKPSKKNRKLIPIIVGAAVLILLAVGVTGYFLYQKHIVKQADNVMAYLDDNDYDEALALYNKYSKKKEAFDDKVFSALKNTTEQIKNDYMSENIDYDYAINQLRNLEHFEITGFDIVIYDISQLIDRINTSRENFQDAEAYYELGDYGTSLEKYGLVLKEDRKYYELAANEINIILQEETERQQESERQEKEQIDEIRNQALIKAEELADEYYYDAAIIAIETALNLIPDDPILVEHLSIYAELYELAIMVPAFDTTLYEYTYTEQGKDIMTVTMELPVLIGEGPGYESINQIFEKTKEFYINENNLMVEDAKLYADDEYFYTYAFGLSYSVQYNNNSILCIVLDGYVYTGGAHGYPLREAYIFDLSSGTLTNLTNLILADDKAFASYITDEFQRMYNETPEDYWPDSLDIIKNDLNNIDTLNYFITEDSLCIYYFPYDLASYARGFVEIIIPFEGNEWMFAFLQ